MSFLLLCPVSDTPLRRFVRFAGTGLFLKSFIFQFFKDFLSKIVIFASPFLHLLPPTHTFFPDLPRNSSTSPRIFSHPIRGTSQGPSWATLGPSWGHLGSGVGPSWDIFGPHAGLLGVILELSWPCKHHLPHRTSETYVHDTHPNHVPERNHIPIRHQGVAPSYAATCLDNWRRSSDLHVDVVSSRHWAGELGMGRTGSS